MEIINRILELLSQKNTNQAALCKYIGIKENVFTTWKMRGTAPQTKYIIQICEFLSVSPYYLLTGKEATDDIGETESKLLSDFRSLSKQGQEYIQQQMFMAKEVYKKVDIPESKMKAG